MTIWRVPVQLTWPATGSPGVNVWHVRCNSGLGADDTELQAGVDSIHSFYTELNTAAGVSGGVFTNGASITLGQVVEVSSSTAGAPTWVTISRGSAVGVAPTVLQSCISWKTTLAARRGRGRTFVGPLSALVVDGDGTPSAAALAAVRAAATNLVGRNSALNGWAVAVYGQESMLKGPNVTPEQRAAAPHVARDIIGSSVRDTFAVLRSRRD